jgi:phage-related protein
VTQTKATHKAAPAAASQPAPRAAPGLRAGGARAQSAMPAVRLSTELASPESSSFPAPALQAVGSSGSGDPLPSGVQSRLEGSLNLSLAPVRVHTDTHAAKAAESLGARAFTYGTHIYFGAREQPGDLSLTAHEVTHVVQQQGRPVLQLCCTGKSGGDAHENEADTVSAAVGRGEPASVEGRTHGPQVQRSVLGRLRGAASSVGGAIAGGARAVGGAVASGARWVGARAGEALEWVEDRAISLIERVAPDLVAFIRRGPGAIVDWLKERLQSALETVVNALAAPVRGITGVVASVSGHVGRLVAWMQDAYAKISRRDCSPVAEAAAKIEQVFNEIASPVFDRIKSLAGRVRVFFTGVWNKFGAPAWDFLKQAGGAAWQRIQEFAGWLWDKAAPVRRLAARAWNWVKNQLGIGEGPDGQNGLLQWMERKATAAWDWVKARIEPIKRPLMIAGGVLLMLSPAGPFIALGAGVAGLIMGVRYLRSMNTPGFIVQARAALHGRIIPAIMSGVNTVTGALARAVSAITGKLDQLTGGMLSLVGAVGGSILRFAVGVVNWIAEQFRALAAWAHDKLVALASVVRNAFNAVRNFLQPVFDVLGRIIAIVANPFGIPGLLMGSAWRLIPECFKGPLINFILRIVIRIVRAILVNPLVGLILWPFIKAGLLGFLEKALAFDTARKVRIADRFAKIASGGSTSFVLGYLGGLVLGLWDGISGPFVLLWDIAELIGGIFSWLGRMLATITDPAVDVGRRLLAAIRGAWDSIRSNIIPAVQAFLSGPADPMRIINFIRDLLNSIVQAAGEAGGRVFDALIGFLNQGDYELGHSLGRFAGNILFEVLLSILTAGGYAAKPIIQRLARWVTGFIGKIAKFASEIMRYFPRLVSAVESVGTFARTNPAMQRIVGAIKGLLSRLAGFLMTMYGVGGAAERGAAAVERGAGAAERGVGAAERAAGTAERAAGTAERGAGAAERAASRGERAAAAGERTAATTERAAGAAERTAGTTERAAGVAEREAAATERAATGTFKREAQVFDAAGEGHHLRMLPDGRIIRCSERCLEAAQDLRNRYSAVMQRLDGASEAGIAAREANKGAMRLQVNTRKLNSLPEAERAAREAELWAEAQRLEAEMARLEREAASAPRTAVAPSGAHGHPQEAQVRSHVSTTHEQPFGVTDDEVRRGLGITGKSADIVAHNPTTGRWLIAESKGSDVGHAIHQFENTLPGLLNQVPGAHGHVDLAIYTSQAQYARFTSPEGLGGYFVRDGMLGHADEAGVFHFIQVHGIPIRLHPAP